MEKGQRGSKHFMEDFVFQQKKSPPSDLSLMNAAAVMLLRLFDPEMRTTSQKFLICASGPSKMCDGSSVIKEFLANWNPARSAAERVTC